MYSRVPACNVQLRRAVGSVYESTQMRALVGWCVDQPWHTNRDTTHPSSDAKYVLPRGSTRERVLTVYTYTQNHIHLSPHLTVVKDGQYDIPPNAHCSVPQQSFRTWAWQLSTGFQSVAIAPPVHLFVFFLTALRSNVMAHPWQTSTFTYMYSVPDQDVYTVPAHWRHVHCAR